MVPTPWVWPIFFAVQSAAAVANVFPSGANATDRIWSRWPQKRVATACPLAASHNLTVLSLLAVAKTLLSGEKAREEIRTVCAAILGNPRPLIGDWVVSSSNRATWPLMSPTAIFWPSGENATAMT